MAPRRARKSSASRAESLRSRAKSSPSAPYPSPLTSLVFAILGLLRAAAEVCEESIPGLRVEHVNISDLPLLNTDLETDGGAGFPPAVQAFCDKVCQADCFLFGSPEYNYSIATRFVQETEPRTARTSRTSQCYVDLNEEPKRKRLSSFLRDNTEPGQEQTDLEQYIKDPLLSWKEGDYFDILSWWKTHSTKYPILGRLARDVLAIPASTVASESAFSAGGRVVDKYRSRLDPQVVEALICSKDWIRASREDQRGVASILDDLAGLTTNDKAEQDEGDHVDGIAAHTIVDQEEI